MKEREQTKFHEHAIISQLDGVASSGRTLKSNEKYFNLGVEMAANREVTAPVSLQARKG